MSLTTWNFPTWQCRDKGPGFTRADAGSGFSTYQVVHQALPFSSAMTGIFSFLAESGKVADAGQQQFITSIGYQGSPTYANFGLDMVMNQTLTSFFRLTFYDHNAAAMRYLWSVGDEDGVNWLQYDKWYQVAFSVNASRLQVVVNGSTTPKVTKTTDAPGTLNLDQGDERWWHTGPVAAWGLSDGQVAFILGLWPSVVLGPSAWEATAIDLSDQTVLDRIYDADGNFKNPGENGSLWFNDTYTTSTGFKPDVFMLDGSPRFDNGSFGLTWGALSGSKSPYPGALRKAYE